MVSFYHISRNVILEHGLVIYFGTSSVKGMMCVALLQNNLAVYTINKGQLLYFVQKVHIIKAGLRH